jgi:hypothetical protein
VIIGADDAILRGQAFIFHGSASGIANADITSADTTISAAIIGNGLGGSVSTAGDINGDGYDDVIVGADRAAAMFGRAYILVGSGSGISDCDLSSGCTPHATLTGPTDTSTFGFSVSTAGDVNGDDYDDVIVGAPDGSHSQNAYIFVGSAAGISSCETLTGCADTTITSITAFDELGSSVANAGDIDASGYSTVIIGAPLMVNGTAYAFTGSATGIADCDLGGACTATVTKTGAAANDDLGYVK